VNYLILLPSLLLSLACAKPAPEADIPRIEPALIKAVIEVESRGNPKAVSRAGCIGLMQIKPSTGRMLGYSRAELFDPEKNVAAGTRYLEMLIDQTGHIEDALAAYNCGPGRRNGAVCRAYAKRVLRHVEIKEDIHS